MLQQPPKIVQQGIPEVMAQMDSGLFIKEAQQLAKRPAVLPLPVQQHRHEAQHHVAPVGQIVRVRGLIVRVLAELQGQQGQKAGAPPVLLEIVQQPQRRAQEERGHFGAVLRLGEGQGRCLSQRGEDSGPAVAVLKIGAEKSRRRPRRALTGLDGLRCQRHLRAAAEGAVCRHIVDENASEKMCSSRFSSGRTAAGFPASFHTVRGAAFFFVPIRPCPQKCQFATCSVPCAGADVTWILRG